MSAPDESLLDYLIDHLTSYHTSIREEKKTLPCATSPSSSLSYTLAEQYQLAYQTWTRQEGERSKKWANSSNKTAGKIRQQEKKNYCENNIVTKIKEEERKQRSLVKTATSLASEWETTIEELKESEKYMLKENIESALLMNAKLIAETELFFQSIKSEIVLEHQVSHVYIESRKWEEQYAEQEVWLTINIVLKPIIVALMEFYNVCKSKFVDNTERQKDYDDDEENNTEKISSDHQKELRFLEQIYYVELLPKVIDILQLIHMQGLTVSKHNTEQDTEENTSFDNSICSSSNTSSDATALFDESTSECSGDFTNDIGSVDSSQNCNANRTVKDKEDATSVEDNKKTFQNTNIDALINENDQHKNLLCKFIWTNLQNNEEISFAFAPLLARVALPCIKECYYYFKSGQQTAQPHQPQFLFTFLREAVVRMHKELCSLYSVPALAGCNIDRKMLMYVAETIVQCTLFTSLRTLFCTTYGWFLESECNSSYPLCKNDVNNNRNKNSNIGKSNRDANSPTWSIASYNTVMINALSDFCIVACHQNAPSIQIEKIVKEVNSSVLTTNENIGVNCPFLVHSLAMEILCKTILLEEALTVYCRNTVKAAENAFKHGAEVLWRREQLTESDNTLFYKYNCREQQEQKQEEHVMFHLSCKTMHFIRFLCAFIRRIEQGLLLVQPALSGVLWNRILAITFRFFLSELVNATEEIEIDWKRWRKSNHSSDGDSDHKYISGDISNNSNCVTKKDDSSKQIAARTATHERWSPISNSKCKEELQASAIYVIDLLHAIFLIHRVVSIASTHKHKLEQHMWRYEQQEQFNKLHNQNLRDAIAVNHTATIHLTRHSPELLPHVSSDELHSSCLDELHLLHDRCVRHVIENYTKEITNELTKSATNNTYSVLFGIDNVLYTLESLQIKNVISEHESTCQQPFVLHNESNNETWRVPQLVRQSIYDTLQNLCNAEQTRQLQECCSLCDVQYARRLFTELCNQY